MLEEYKRLTWTKYIVLSKIVENIRVKDKRALFHVMRSNNVNKINYFQIPTSTSSIVLKFVCFTFKDMNCL